MVRPAAPRKLIAAWTLTIVKGIAMQTPRNPGGVHSPLAPYSHQIEVTGAERWLVLSGQVGMHPDRSIPGDAAEQLDLALANVMRNLDAAGMAVADLVKLTLYLVDEIAPDARAAVLRERLGDVQPCMTLVYVPRLAAPPLKVEVDAWAAA
jgi:enamine deaminase RidA (YjgF/YER057c/UK114 family)